MWASVWMGGQGVDGLGGGGGGGAGCGVFDSLSKPNVTCIICRTLDWTPLQKIGDVLSSVSVCVCE